MSQFLYMLPCREKKSPNGGRSKSLFGNQRLQRIRKENQTKINGGDGISNCRYLNIVDHAWHVSNVQTYMVYLVYV